MDLNEKAIQPFDLLSTDLAPNQYHLESPFEFLHLAVENKDQHTLTIFVSNTQGSYYNRTDLSDLPITADKLARIGLHTHDYYEFMFVLEGEIYQNIDCLRHYYPRGGCCIVAPDIPHSEEYGENTSARLLFVKLRADYVTSLLGLSHFFDSEDTAAYRRCADFFASPATFLDFIPRRDLTWQAEQVHSLFEKMVNILLSPGESASLEISLLIYKVLLILFDTSLYGNTPVPPGTEEETRLFLDLRRYMESLPGKCSRADLEKRFHFSGDYLYKLVRTHSGLSIHDYSMRICMKKAADLLRSTDRNVNDIAEELGFHNYTQFYEVFREHYQVTPRAYRRG